MFDKTSNFNHNFFTEQKQSRVIRRQKNNHWIRHTSHFQKHLGVSGFLKQILKLSFAHSNFLYNIYELTNALGDSVFAYSW